MQDSQARFVIVGRCYNTAVPEGPCLGVIKTHADPAQEGVENRLSLLPDGLALSVYPNPFNGATRIEFTLASTQSVSLRLHDVLGREVAVLMNEVQTAGKHEMMFDASGLPSGVYLCRLEAGGLGQTRKIVLIR